MIKMTSLAHSTYTGRQPSANLMVQPVNVSFKKPVARQMAKVPPVHDRCFEGIRGEYRKSFDDWKTGAPDTSVRVFAETCRALRYFNAPGQTYSTTYGRNFIQHVPDR